MQEGNIKNMDILLDSDASLSEITAIKDVATKEGIHGSVEATLSSRSLEISPWVIILLAPIGVFFSSFFSTIGKEAGRETYQGLRRLISRLFDARRNSNGSVELSDDKTRTHIILTVDLPEKAYTQLTQKGLGQLKGGYWTWDSKLKTWNRL